MTHDWVRRPSRGLPFCMDDTHVPWVPCYEVPYIVWTFDRDATLFFSRASELPDEWREAFAWALELLDQEAT